MKTPTRLILLASIGSSLALAQEPERTSPLPAPERPGAGPEERRLGGDRPRGEGERPRGERDEFRPEGDRPRERREGGDGDRPRPEGERPRPDAERPRREGEERRPDGERPRIGGDRARPEGERRADGEHREGERGPGDSAARPTRPFGPGDGFPGNRGDILTRIPQKPQPYIGIVTRNASPDLSSQLRQPEGFGLVVEEVLPDTPAKNAGLERNDVLLRFDDQLLVNPPQLEALVRRAGKDKDATLTILRAGEERKITIRIAEKMLPEHRGYPNLPGRFMAPHTPGSGWKESQPSRPLIRGGAASGGERVETERETRYVRNQARVMRSDEDGRYELLSIDGTRTLIAQKPDGSVAWRGPVETPAQREAVPADLRKKLELLEQGIVAERPDGAPAADQLRR